MSQSIDEVKRITKGLDEEDDLDSKFFSSLLLEEINKEFSKKYVGCDRQKLLAFLILLTGLREEEFRCSANLKGNSSEGKSHLINTIRKHIPEEKYEWLTSCSDSELQDNSIDKPILIFNEINEGRENGANKASVETIKQLSEDGLSSRKKDIRTGFKTSLHTKTGRKTTMFSTTESIQDEEKATRLFSIYIDGSESKYKEVNHKFILSKLKPSFNTKNLESWICKGLRKLDFNLEVIIPYAELLSPYKKIKNDEGEDVELFPHNKARVMRDFPRLILISEILTILFQKQRYIEIIDDKKIIYSEPSDFITAYELSKEIYGLSYSEIDKRLLDCYNKIKDLEGKHDSIITEKHMGKFGYVLRHILQEDLNISLNTLKERLKELKRNQLIEDYYDNSTQYILLKTTGIKWGIKGVSMGISLIGIDRHLTPFLTPINIRDIYKGKKIKGINLDFLLKKDNFTHKVNDFDTYQIDTYQKPPIVCDDDTSKDDFDEEFISDSPSDESSFKGLGGEVSSPNNLKTKFARELKDYLLHNGKKTLEQIKNRFQEYNKSLIEESLKILEQSGEIYFLKNKWGLKE